MSLHRDLTANLSLWNTLIIGLHSMIMTTQITIKLVSCKMLLISISAEGAWCWEKGGDEMWVPCLILCFWLRYVTGVSSLHEDNFVSLLQTHYLVFTHRIAMLYQSVCVISWVEILIIKWLRGPFSTMVVKINYNSRRLPDPLLRNVWLHFTNKTMYIFAF